MPKINLKQGDCIVQGPEIGRQYYCVHKVFQNNFALVEPSYFKTSAHSRHYYLHTCTDKAYYSRSRKMKLYRISVYPDCKKIPKALYMLKVITEVPKGGKDDSYFKSVVHID